MPARAVLFISFQSGCCFSLPTLEDDLARGQRGLVIISRSQGGRFNVLPYCVPSSWLRSNSQAGASCSRASQPAAYRGAGRGARRRCPHALPPLPRSDAAVQWDAPLCMCLNSRCGGHAEDRPRTEASKAKSSDGYDVQLQANAISHFLFTRLLMPALQIAASARGAARIINCTSGGYSTLSADVPAEAFARIPPNGVAKAPHEGVAAGGGARANAYGVVPAEAEAASAAAAAERTAKQRNGRDVRYKDCRDRQKQSRKANLVFSMALRVRRLFLTCTHQQRWTAPTPAVVKHGHGQTDE